jgi:hypothetical protein
VGYPSLRLFIVHSHPSRLTMAEFSSEKQVPLSDDKVAHDAGLGGNKDASPLGSGEEGLVDVSGIDEKSLLRRLDLKLLPPLSLLYLLSFLDRSNGMFSPLLSCLP